MTATLEAPTVAPTRSGRGAVVLFSATSFVGSFLLFLVQPTVAKMLLPSLGGTPAVWNTSMVFFQVTLVAGYGLAHAGLRLLRPARQRVAQVVALAAPLALLPLALPPGWRPPVAGSPAVWLLVVLAVMVGAPFLMLSTCSPTLQHWFATGRGTRGRDPYFLYAAGNAGSLLALLAYPLVVERRLSLDGQARLFTLGYGALVVLSAACALRATHRAGAAPPAPVADAGGEAARPVTWADRARWTAWAAIPSALLLGVTRHLTTDVMSVPMLWVAPLALYLLTFIVAFGRAPDRTVSVAAKGLRLATIPLALTLVGGSRSLGLVLGLHLAAFTLAALLGHGRLAQSRPAPAHLTEFYLVVSIGGALGGAVTSLLAPLVFPTVIEYPLAIVAALAMCPRRPGSEGLALRVPSARTIAGAAGLAAALALALHLRAGGELRSLTLAGLLLGAAGVVAHLAARTPRGFAAAMAVLLAVAVVPAAGTLRTERSFFGVTTVETDAQGRHRLVSGSTVHGLQDPEGADPDRPLAYYHPAGPIGRWFTDLRPDRPVDVGLIGLGSGALAGYGRAGDRMTYFEIDPAVVDIAQDPDSFTYLSDSEAAVDVVLGDGRLTLARTGGRYDALVLDAFSSDAIPVHLLTREAVEGYLAHLAHGGVLAVHISNRYFDLEPVLARLAIELDLAGVVGRLSPTAAQEADGAQAAKWVFLAPDPATLGPYAADDGWQPIDRSGAGPLWTDDHSDILGVLGGN